MPALNVGIKLASLGMPMKRAVQTAAQLGATGIELDARGEIRYDQFTGTALRELRKMLTDLGVRVCAVGFHTRRGYDAPDDLQRRVDATKSAMRFAFALGAPVVINHIGCVPADDSSPVWSGLVEVLADLGGYGQHVGAMVAAETGTESGPALRKLIDALPAANQIAVSFNPGNLIVHGFSASEAATALSPCIAHVHAKDAVRDLAQGRGVEVPLGRGSADFPALLGILGESGYRGYFTVERDNAEDPVTEIGLAVQYLRNL
jgi:sugar phosphate isomerase/epimerase